MLNNEAADTQPQALEKATADAPAKVENEISKPEDEDAALLSLIRDIKSKGDDGDEAGEVDGADAPGKGDNRKKVDRNPDGTFKGDEAKALKAEKTVAGNADPKAEGEAKTEQKPKADKAAKSADPVEGEESKEKPKASAHSPGHFRGWSTEKRAAFDKLPPEAQNFVIEHQGEILSTKSKSETELRTYAEKSAPLVKVFQDNADYLNQISRDLKMPSHEIVGNILKTEATLRTGTMDQKRQILEAMARDYGVEVMLGDTSEQDARDHDLRQENARLKRQIEEQAAQQNAIAEQYQEQTVHQTRGAIEKFRSATGEDGELLHPHFDDYRPQIAHLIKTGKAETLEEAYEIAIRPIREAEERVRKKAESERSRTEAAERARRAGRLNVNTATGEVVQYASEDDAILGAIRSARASS